MTEIGEIAELPITDQSLKEDAEAVREALNQQPKKSKKKDSKEK